MAYCIITDDDFYANPNILFIDDRSYSTGSTGAINGYICKYRCNVNYQDGSMHSLYSTIYVPEGDYFIYRQIATLEADIEYVFDFENNVVYSNGEPFAMETYDDNGNMFEVQLKNISSLLFD